jgi:RHS repeat-associated protein
VPDTVGTNRATYVLVRNMRGDVIAVATLDGRILESYRYTTYGELVSASSCTSVVSPDASLCPSPNNCVMVPVCTPHSPVPGLQPFSRLGNTALWAGVHRDPHAGWDWMGARVYMPALRQFLSRDPAGYAVSTDEWAYAPGDPWNFVDPTGWSPWKYGNDKQVGGAKPDRWPTDTNPSDSSIMQTVGLHLSPARRVERFETTTVRETAAWINFDYYEVVITRLPDGVSSSAELWDDIVEEFPTFFDMNQEGGELSFVLGSDNGVPDDGDLYMFQLSVWTAWEQLFLITSTDSFEFSGSVVNHQLEGAPFPATDTIAPGGQAVGQWIFTTASGEGGWDVSAAVLLGETHPVAGNRMFGVYENVEGDTVFFTAGVDSTSGFPFSALSPLVFAGAQGMWTSLTVSVVEHVEQNGGAAHQGRMYSERFGRE